MSELQLDMLHVIAGKIASLQMQELVYERTGINPEAVMTVLCTAADVLRGVNDD